MSRKLKSVEALPVDMAQQLLTSGQGDNIENEE